MDLPDRRPVSPDFVAAALIAVLALVVRVHGATAESLWMDEILQVSFYGHGVSPSGLWQVMEDAASQQQPPLDYWIGAIIQSLWPGDFTARLPSICFGVGAVVLLIQIIRRACDPPAGIMMGLVLALLPFAIYFSQEARPYAIVIFLLLALLRVLDHANSSGRLRLRDCALVFVITLLFLHSSALAPLVIVVSLILFWICQWLLRVRREGFLRTLNQRRDLTFCGVSLLAILAYLPAFGRILKRGSPYLDDPDMHIWNAVGRAFERFSSAELWRTYIVQTDPLGPALLPFVLCGLLLAALNRSWRRRSVIVACAWLLPVAPAIYALVFHGNVRQPLRPPYLMFILPLCLIIATVPMAEMNERIAASGLARRTRPLVLTVLFVVVAALGGAVNGLKTSRHRTDWRGLAWYLYSELDDGYLLMFDSLSPYGEWEPTFFGFGRYYRGRSPRLGLQNLRWYSSAPEPDRFAALTPVYVLFEWRNCYLTPDSWYPYRLPPAGIRPIDVAALVTDSDLSCRRFTGFAVARLRDSSGNGYADALALIRRVIAVVPPDSTRVDLHLAAASLGWSLGQAEWKKEIEYARALAPARLGRRIDEYAAALRTGAGAWAGRPARNR